MLAPRAKPQDSGSLLSSPNVGNSDLDDWTLHINPDDVPSLPLISLDPRQRLPSGSTPTTKQTLETDSSVSHSLNRPKPSAHFQPSALSTVPNLTTTEEPKLSRSRRPSNDSSTHLCASVQTNGVTLPFNPFSPSLRYHIQT